MVTGVPRVGTCASCHWCLALGFMRLGASLSLCVLHDVDSAHGPQGGVHGWCRWSILSSGTQAGPIRDKEMPFGTVLWVFGPLNTCPDGHQQEM